MKCKECGQHFPERRFFVQHLRKVHKGLKIEPEIVPAGEIDLTNFECDSCDKTYMSKTSLSAHKKKHFKEHVVSIHKGKMFNCEKCEKSFISSDKLKRHEGVHEFKDKGQMLKCKECGKKFSTRNSFVQHESKVHKGLKIEPEIVPAENIEFSASETLDGKEFGHSNPIIPSKLHESLKIGPEVVQDENTEVIAPNKLERKAIVQSCMTPMESKPKVSEFKRGMWIVKLDKMASNDHL